MQVEVSKTHLAPGPQGRLIERRTVQARFDIPADQSTTVYINGEPALIIEP